MARIRWKRLADEAEVRAILLRELPLGTSADAVHAFLTQQNLPHSELASTIICSAPARRRDWFFGGEWRMTFTVREGRLVEIAIARGFTGP